MYSHKQCFMEGGRETSGSLGCSQGFSTPQEEGQALRQSYSKTEKEGIDRTRKLSTSVLACLSSPQPHLLCHSRSLHTQVQPLRATGQALALPLKADNLQIPIGNSDPHPDHYPLITGDHTANPVCPSILPCAPVMAHHESPGWELEFSP